MTLIRFGTDGWRAVIGDEYTYENVRYCAEGVARYLENVGLASRGLVVGYDTRFSSEDFAAATAEVVAAHGIPVSLFDRSAPTPLACLAILQRQAGGAAVITASHNPGRYSGFKYKPEYAGSAPPEIVSALEAGIDASQVDHDIPRLSLEQATDTGKVTLFDPIAPYLEHVGRTLDLGRVRDAGLNVVFDAMHATGAGLLSSLAGAGKTRVAEIRAERNPAFPGMAAPEPITRNLAALAGQVIATGADVGLATDGDADRLGVIDEKGAFVDQLQTFALLCYYLLEYRGERGPLVRSVTSTRMIDRLGEIYGVPVFETPVGFKFVGPKMMETGAIAAGEESGGYAFAGHLPERDGTFAGLLFLDLMARAGKKPSELVEELYAKVGRHYYDRADVHLAPDQREAAIARVAAARPTDLAGVGVKSIDAIDGFRFELENGGWVLIRPSGTEPLLRVYTETTDQSLVQPLLSAGRRLAGV
jgi:phosphomannomutase